MIGDLEKQKEGDLGGSDESDEFERLSDDNEI